MLSTLIWLPLVGALLVGCLPGGIPVKQLRFGTIAIVTVALLWSLWLLTQFDLSSATFQMPEYLPWIPTLGLNYSLAIDGLSLPLVALSNLLTIVAIFASELVGKTALPLQRPRLFYVLVLLINAGMAGALMAQNLLLFFLFYELELIPFYLLIVIWGGAKREYAGMKFLIYTALSGILILAAFLAIGWLTGSNFDYETIQTGDLSQRTQLILLTLLLVGFGIKIPLIPLHTWLPDAYVEASTPTAILLGGVLSKLGVYGLVRFGLGLFPETWSLVTPGLALIAAICVMYGAMAAIAQKDIKRMVAYSSIGHMGYVLLGAAALTPLSMVGAVAQMVSHGLILALLFYLVGTIEAKVGTRELDVLNGLLNAIRGLPMTSALLVLAGMASAGIPGMVGFISEFLVFQGSYPIFPLQTLLCVVGTGLTAVYFVIMLNRTCFGKLDTATAYYPKVTLWEQVPALALTALIIWLGIQPTWLVRWSETTTATLAGSAPIAHRIVALEPTASLNHPLSAQVVTPSLQ
ncbi:NADH-quinone oxidoreductase subunit M [Pantanalinema rosaneae CENA516]|uniref:NADH-quinone oxidoreductase subunit M n=1 Tax=Pantanalinema rosaneae TaxID=1620701 RepID=UPI003D6DCF94